MRPGRNCSAPSDIDELPYTFGIEFETAGGFLPQHRLYELGLIPLRDGSITGIEFATVVLKGNTV